MLMQTKDLLPPALNWAVAKALGEYRPVPVPAYSTDWSQGGPIVERHEIELRIKDGEWFAECWLSSMTKHATEEGPTPLIAAMRCYVAAELGDEVDIPEELL